MYCEASHEQVTERKKTRSELMKDRIARKKRERSGKPKDPKRSRAMKKAWRKNRTGMMKGTKTRKKYYSQSDSRKPTNEASEVNEAYKIGSRYEGSKGVGVIVKVETTAEGSRVFYSVGTKNHNELVTNEGTVQESEDSEDESQKIIDEVIQYLEAEGVSDEWTEAIEGLDDSVLEAFNPVLKGMKKNSKVGEFISIDIGGKEYGYTPNSGSVKELGRKLAKMMTFSKGKAVAWLKKNAVHQYGGTKPDVPGGSKVTMKPDALAKAKKE